MVPFEAGDQRGLVSSVFHPEAGKARRPARTAGEPLYRLPVALTLLSHIYTQHSSKYAVICLAGFLQVMEFLESHGFYSRQVREFNSWDKSWSIMEFYQLQFKIGIY